MTSSNVKKVSLSELKTMVREAVALQLGKKAGEKKETGVERREDIKKDKEKGDSKGKPFGGKQAAPFGSKNESVVQKVTLEQLRGMVKEAISMKLKEMGHEWGTEFEPGEDESLLGVGGSDLPEPEKSPEEKAKAYNLAMGTDPSQAGWEERAMEDLEHAIQMLGRLGVTKQGRAGLADRIKELETALSVPASGRHFAGDREEMGEATPAYAPSVRGPDKEAERNKYPAGGLTKHDPRKAATSPGGTETPPARKV